MTIQKAGRSELRQLLVHGAYHELLECYLLTRGSGESFLALPGKEDMMVEYLKQSQPELACSGC